MSATAQMVDSGLAAISNEIAKLPKHWAFIPVGGNKAPQYTDWQNSGFAAADFDRVAAAERFEGAVCKAGTDEAFTLPISWVKAAGVLCGEPSGGLLFFDHDGHSGDPKILELSGQRTIADAMPRTPVVTSGRSGRYQAIYQVPEQFWSGVETTKIGTKFATKPSGQVVAVEGIEFRWTGAQSVVVGAHPETGGYRWHYHPSDTPVAEAPSWMIEAMLAEPESADSPVTWGEFDRSFSLPCDHRVSLLAACAPRTRNAVEQGATDKGRNDTGAQIARDLLGTATYLDGIGQKYDGNPKAIFVQWCDRFGLSQDKPKGQPKTIWAKAEKDRPSPSLNPTQIEGCLKSWVWKNAEHAQSGAQHVQQCAIDKPQAESDDEPLTADNLRRAVAEYASEEDVFERHLLARQIGADYGARGNALDSLTQALEPPSTGGVQGVSEIMAGVFDDIEARSMGKVTPGVKTGFYDLDGMTDGFQPSDLIVIAGRPAMGKTALAMGLTMGAALEGTKVLVFSLEMGKDQLVRRLLSAVCSIEATRLRAGTLGQHEWDPLGSAISRISALPIVIDDTPEQTVLNMEAVAKKHSPAMVVVDHCQLLDGPGRDEYAKVTYNTKKLKALARKLNIPIILLSQLSRAVEGTNTKRPAMSHLKQSGSIEQDADLVMMLYREEYYDPDTSDKGVAEVIIGKHRNGPTGTVKLLFEPQYTRFRNMASSIG